MTRWIVQSFDVADPRARVSAVRHHLPVTATVGVVPVPDGERVRADSADELIALTTNDIMTDEMRSPYAIDITDGDAFGTYMDLVLEPGEQGAVMGCNDTTSSGAAAVYQKHGQDDIEFVEYIGGDEGEQGADAASTVEREYGFRPHRRGSRSIEVALDEQDDPLLKYQEIKSMEGDVGTEWLHIGDPVCPTCGTALDAADRSPPWQQYRTKYYCENEDCRVVSVDVCDPADVPAPAQSCPDCGGAFTPADLQYDALASTAYTCDGCGAVTFDFLEEVADYR